MFFIMFFSRLVFLLSVFRELKLNIQFALTKNFDVRDCFTGPS